jgi:hypothetical protein
VEEVDPATGLITDVHTTSQSTFAGASASEPSPWAAQVLARWRTGVYVGGREVRGRTFFPGPLESNITDGVLPVVAVNAYDLIWSTHLADADTLAAGDRVIWSQTHGAAYNVSSASTWNQLAVMRSRRPL